MKVDPASSALPRRRRAVMSLITVFLALSACEVLQRLADWRRAKDPATLRTYRLESTRGDRVDEGLGALVMELDDVLWYRNRAGQRFLGTTTNAWGFRGPDRPLSKATGTARVAVLGGSSAFGYLIDEDADVFTSVLERRLARTAPGQSVEVWNFGVVGYMSTQELTLVTTEVLDMDPDLVVFFDGWNDFNLSGGAPPSAPVRVGTFSTVEDRIGLANNPVRAVLQWSAFYRGLARRGGDVARLVAEQRAEGRPHGRYTERPDAIDRYGKNLRRAIRTLKAHGVRALVFVQPEIMQRSGPVPESEQRIRDQQTRGYRSYATSVYPRFREAARDAASQEGSTFIDGTILMDGRDEHVFVDPVHWNRAGQEILADALEPAVRAELSRRR